MKIAICSNFLMYLLTLLVVTATPVSNGYGATQDKKGLKKSSSKKRPHCSCELKTLCEIKDELEELEHAFDKATACGNERVIDKLPATITRSGKYCVNKDLLFSDAGTAIKIEANNVTLNFNNHSLTLTDPGAIGVFIKGVSEVTIENDIIQSSVISSDRNAAIAVENADKITINNVFTSNTFFGIAAIHSTDLKISNSRFSNHIGGTPAAGLSAAVFTEAVVGLVVENSTVTGVSPTQSTGNDSTGILLIGTNDGIPTSGCRISNCQFAETDLAILAAGVNGLLIENCSFEAGANAEFALIQLGRSLANLFANDVIIRNCTLTNKNPIPAYLGILMLRGSGCLVEDVIVDIAGARSPTFGQGVGIAIGLGAPYSNVTIRNSVISGPSTYGIEIGVPSTGVVIDNCQVSNGQEANILIQSSSQTIVKNSFIANSSPLSGTAKAPGIQVRNNTVGAAIIGNTVANNAGDGIRVDSGATNTNIQKNSVFGNTETGIDNAASSSETFFNTSCNNAGSNCVGVAPAQAPGAPAVAGSNVCCR